MTVYTEEELRHMAISLLTAETTRDQQVRVGASDLSNQCDHCVALALKGVRRISMVSEKTWMGRVIGTSIHSHTEAQGAAHPDIAPVEFERTVTIGEIRGYGTVGGHIDWTLEDQLVDTKGSTRKKSAVLQDYLQSLGLFRVGLKPRWEKQARGNYKLDLGSSTYCTLSEAEFKKEMAAMEYKLSTYFNQLSLYGLARSREGHPPRRLSIVFVNRDGVGTFDVPHLADYENPERKHDVWSFGFDYSETHALGVMNRAQDIFDRLAAGAEMESFERHDLCFMCSEELAAEVRNRDIVATFGSVAA